MVTLRINLAHARHNIKLIKQHTNAAIYAVVKADAYGHGARLAEYIQNEVYGFAVSCESEAEELCKLKIKKPILILCPSKTINYKNIIYTVTSINDLPKKKGEKIAIKINSGMNRLGVNFNDIDLLIKAIKQNCLQLTQVFTHFSSTNSASKQFSYFKQLCDSKIDTSFNKKIFRHCCASNCMSLPKQMICDAVRCGLAIYGYGFKGLMPILNAYTYIGQINYVKKGEIIGYADVTADKDMNIAILKGGYADGIQRGKNRLVRINGCNCKIVGNVCMDMCMADVTDAYAQKGDRAYFLDNALNADVLAGLQNTVPYEILTMFSAKRINRIYEY